MRRFERISDQLYNWSDKYEEFSRKAAPESRGSHPSTSSDEARVFTRISDRALQKVRQSWLPMRGRPWPWSQILLVGEPPRPPSRDDLRSAVVRESGRSLPGKFSRSPCVAGRNLRNQSRVTETAGRLLERCDGARAHSSPEVYRSVDGRNRRGQHDSRLFPFETRQRGVAR